MTDFTEFLYKTRGGKIRVKRGTWEKVENHKIYAKWLKEKLRYENEEDWYKITAKQIIDNYGGGLLQYYNNSTQQFINEMFPDYEWKSYKFTCTLNGYWNKIENQQEYTNDLGTHLGYTNMEDWYDITAEKINKYYGRGLLHYYNRSPQQFINAMFPDYEWKPYRFIHVPKNHWNKIENQQEYTNDLGTHLGYTNMEDWYDITVEKIIKYYGYGLLHYYNNSTQQFINAMFPDYEWKGYKFSSAPNGYWDKIENQQEYANDLGKHLEYTEIEHWYQITKQQIKDYYGGGLLTYYYDNSPQVFVNAMFPDYPWINSKFKKKYSQGQIQWLKYMCVSTPDIRHILNHDDGEYKIPGSRYYADGYSDEELCIFEYHGDYWHGNPKIYNQEEINKSTRTTFGELYEKTLEKQRFCEESGYNYVSIWESEWIRAKLAVIKLQQKWKNKKN